MIAATMPNNEITTKQLKELIPDYIVLTPIDLAPSDTRANECLWHQVVGNVVSHQFTGTSIFTRGFAIRTEDGLIVTDAGIEFLETLDEM
jgi:hypothetical protein